MSGLISSNEAKLAWANGEQLQVAHLTQKAWETLTDNYMLSVFDDDSYVFRLTPRTITINGIEVPCSKSKHDKDDVVWVINTACENWYDWIYGSDCDSNTLYWETEEEIKQVVAALRSVFKIIKLQLVTCKE